MGNADFGKKKRGYGDEGGDGLRDDEKDKRG